MVPLSGFLLFLLPLVIGSSSKAATRVKRGQAGEVVVVEGGEVSIPCAITPPPVTSDTSQYHSRRGTVQLILWYKEGYKTAIYSYDGRDPQRPQHWSNNMGGTDSSQLSFTLPPTPPPMDQPHLAFLKLSHAHSLDEGVYSCRVDYYRARTTETRTQLTVVVSPSQPMVEVWAGGRWRTPARETSATQVEIGAHLTLRCTVTGGRPPPEVTWWRGGEQLLGSVEEVGGVVRSAVEVVVGAADAHTPLVCQAANTPLAPPLRTPLHLLVLSSPSWVRVMGANKPMSAGTTYVVECRSKGARPPPVLTWSVGGERQVYASSQTDSEGETVSRLRYTPEASHAGSLLTCTARPPDHTAHSTPTAWVKSDSVSLSIMYKPEVELNFRHLGNNKKTRKPPPFSRSSFSSSSSSSKNDERKEESQTTNKNDEDDDGGGGGGGRAEGGEGGGGDIQQLTESYMGEKEDPEEVTQEEEEEEEAAAARRETYSLAEGEGGVLQCHVRANPPAFHVSWHRDGVPLVSGSRGSWGVVVGNMSVVLQRARREDAGDYTCTAHNPEGSSRSDPVRLEINHGPMCQRLTPLVLGVPRHHPLNVTCEVSSYPPPSGFSWALRSSVGLLQVPQNMITWRDTTSWISYTPRAAQDYGELLCWAHTSTGSRQKEPCVARLQPADTPDAPERCRVSRRTPSSLTVSCTAAHDGGLPQTFHVTVSSGGRHVSNASSATSEVTVRGLQADTAYSLTLWSANTHGASRRITLQASTTPANITVSTSSSMNGHASEDNREEGPLSSLGPPLVAVVAVVTVVGIVVGVVAGVLTRNITLPTRYSANHDDDDDDYHAAPPPSPGRRLKVHLRRSGRGNGALAEHLRRPSARYEFLRPERREPHVYDDPVPLRREKRDKIYEELRATPETECSTLSATPSDPESLISRQFSWHLPCSRLLRNNDFKDPPRKPVRVDPPKLPETGLCGPQTPVTVSPPPVKSTSGLDFHLILIPETSKMLQFAVERDTRLKSYFSKDMSSHLTDVQSKFPVITEEDELKPSTRERNVCVASDPQTLPQSEETFLKEGPAGIQDQSRAPVPTIMVEDGEAKLTHLSRQEAPPRQSGAIVRLNNMKNMSWDLHTPKVAQESMTNIEESMFPLTPGMPELKVAKVNSENVPVTTTHISKPSPGNDTRIIKNYDALSRQDRDQNVCVEERKQYNKTEENNAAATIPLLPFPAHDGVENLNIQSVPGNSTPSVPMPTRLHSSNAVSSSNSTNNRHHPYSTPLASIKRSYRAPASAQLAAILDPMIVHVDGSVSPRPSFPSQHKTRIGLTTLFSLTASSSNSSSAFSSSTSSSSSSSSSSMLRKRGFRRSGRRTNLASPFWRPRSVPTTSGLAMATSPCYLQAPNASSRDSSNSSPPSPRSSSSFSAASSSSSSSSSCFPYSSTAPSSPLSSFYSSENSLPISVSLSHASSSSFQFPTSASSFSSSGTSASSSAATTSPFSSFLSPSLTSHSTSSILSLSSCSNSTSPESTFSGQITPT